MQRCHPLLRGLWSIRNLPAPCTNYYGGSFTKGREPWIQFACASQTPYFLSIAVWHSACVARRIGQSTASTFSGPHVSAFQTTSERERLDCFLVSCALRGDDQPSNAKSRAVAL